MRPNQIKTEPHRAREDRTGEHKMGRDGAWQDRRLDRTGRYRTGRDGTGCALDRPEQVSPEVK